VIDHNPMSFLEQIFASLERDGDAVVIREAREGGSLSLTARELLAQVQVARAYLRRLRLKNGDRCALPNGLRWIWQSWQNALRSFLSTRGRPQPNWLQ